MRQRRHHAGQRTRFIQRDAGLGLLAGGVYLDEHVQRGQQCRALLRQPLCNFFTVDGLHPLETLGHNPSLVALERTDQVPFERRHCSHLFNRFLHIVFAESCLPGRARFGDARAAMRF